MLFFSQFKLCHFEFAQCKSSQSKIVGLARARIKHTHSKLACSNVSPQCSKSQLPSRASCEHCGLLTVLCLCSALSACAVQPSTDWAELQSSAADAAKLIELQSLVDEMADWEHLEPRPDFKDDLTVPMVPFSSSDSGRAAKRGITVQLIAAPIEQVLHTLANDAGLTLQLNQPLTGFVTLLAADQSIEQVLSQIALQVPIYWKINDGILHLWGEQPYTESYAVDYLNLDRSTRSKVGLATQVGTINSSGDNGTSGTSNSSQTSLENSADHHFWASLAIDMEGMVKRAGQSVRSSYTINRDAGMVTLHAPARMHEVLKNYLVKLNDNAQRQVLIEATVVEVALSNDFQAGIDWRLLSENSEGVSAAQIFSGAPLVSAETANRITAPNGLLSLVQRTGEGTISATVNLLEQFGDVRILSKPRIIALNNQSSVLKVVDNRVYFTVNVERARSENKDEVITETEIHTVPVGLVMNVTPYIDKAGGVMLNVRPTLSRILGFVDDPNPELAVADVRNSVPEIQVREMESMLRVNSGDVAIIGGLMQEITDGSDQQLPGLASIPLLGALFRQKRKQRRQTELLIVLKPTVLANNVDHRQTFN